MPRRGGPRRRERAQSHIAEPDSDSEGDAPVRAPRVFDASDDEPEGIVGDDEEIDSDEAFGEDDEEGLSTGVPGSKKAYKQRSAEDSDDGDAPLDFEDDDGDDLVALSNLLDEAPEDEESEEEVEDDEDMDAISLDDDDLAALSSRKRSRDDDSAKPAKRPARLERTEAVQESTDAASGGAKLRLEDLMQASQGAASLSKVKALASNKAGSAPVASKRGGGMLHAPLPTPVQDRMDRAAAYSLTKDEVQGWAPTIKRLREAEHLSFPLQKPAQPPAASNAGLVASFQPSTDMERSVATLVEEAGLTEKQLAEQEGLAMRGLDAEEANQRQLELRRMRELMFRAEQKARRANKIKSKTYRRIHRKERERLQQQMAELNAAQDDQDEDEDEADAHLQAAKDRAKERATLRHKNTGKWAKLHAGRHDEASQEARLAVEEQLQRGEQLRKRIHAQNSDDDESLSDNSDRDEDPQASAFDELAQFEQREALRDAQDDAAWAAAGKKGKGVYQMKFMKDARERHARQARETVAQLKEDLARMDNSDTDDDNAPRDHQPSGVQVSQRSSGRAVYGPTTGASVSTSATAPNPFSTGEANPWLAGEASATVSKKKPTVAVGKDSSATTRSAHRTERHLSRGDEARASAQDEATLAIDPTAQLQVRASDHDEDTNSEDEPIEVTKQHSRGRRGRKGHSTAAQAPMQRALVAEAFAGDDVALEFAREKRAVAQADAPKVEDMTLPGWGSWGGKGARRKTKKQPHLIKKTPGLDPSKRKDFGMENVILNERLDKKASKYKAKDLPYPYTSAAQYEAAMRTPLGAEWNTRTQHQRLTLPRVTTKMGQRIDPIRTYIDTHVRAQILKPGTPPRNI